TTGMFGWLKSKKKANAETEVENNRALHRAKQQTDRILTSLATDIQQLQGGDIIVGNNPDGAGTEFRFTIPLRNTEDARRTSEQSSLPLLLIVDDNSDMLTYMSKSFSSDYRVVTATNGVEALRQLEQEDVDIIVSDVMMPEMDGLELCRRVKTDIETSHVPVVLLTAKTLTSDELQGLEAGADDYVTKPFSMDILRQRVRKLLERSHDQHERFAKEIDIEPSEITVTSLDEQFIAKAISIVEAHISESEFGVEELSNEMGVHRAQLYKKLEHLTGKSPQQFIRILRLKRGKQLLEQSGLYVSEVAYRVGFNSPRIFSKYFKEEFGITPKKYSK
ncbi:MAG: response regulator, partial [Prevotella sp.]|nr:response regulator [Prevotella sp.]